VPESYGEGCTLTSAQLANCILVIALIADGIVKVLKAKDAAVDRNTNSPLLHFAISLRGILGCAEIQNSLGKQAADFMKRVAALRTECLAIKRCG
jgi:hypothetical protein